MSMSQEEIEALMNGLDAEEETQAEEPAGEEPSTQEDSEETDSNEVMSEDDIEALIAQTQNQETASEEENSAEEEPHVEELAVEENIEDVPAQEEENETSVQDDVDQLLNGIDITEEHIEQELPTVEDIEPKAEAPKVDVDHEAIARSWTDKQIQDGVFPMPVEKNTKVVEQLSQVATDSEEKATRIFDVLSYIMDENLVVQKNSKELESFVESQIALLNTLSQKFPNIDLFKEHLATAQSIQGKGSEIAAKVDSENMQLFEAMELMQFHDINRQKIERVMSVIRKLNDYLNGIFEDDKDYKDVAVAKHIHGDSNNELVGDDDLDALIAEFGS